MPSLLKKYSLLPIILILTFLFLSSQESLQTNLLNLQLSKAIYNPENEPHPTLINQITSLNFNSNNPLAAWWGGYYLLSKSGSFETAKTIWEEEPAFSSVMLVKNANKIKNDTKLLKTAKIVFELEPESLSSKILLADALLKNGQWEKAAEFLDKSLAFFPNDDELLAMRGYAEFKQGGSVLKAEVFLNEARKINPDQIRVYLYYLYMYQTHGTQDQVIEIAIDGLDVSKKQNHIYINIFEGHLVDAYIRQSKLEKVPEHLESMLLRSPNSDWFNMLAGKYYMKIGNFKEAEKFYSKAVEIKPGEYYYFMWGKSLISIGNINKAIEAYCKAIELDPNYSLVKQELLKLNRSCQD